MLVLVAAIAQYGEKALAASPDNLATLTLLANALAEKGRADRAAAAEAVEAYREVLRRNPRHADATLVRGLFP